jgi:hypothetical protein
MSSTGTTTTTTTKKNIPKDEWEQRLTKVKVNKQYVDTIERVING